MSKLNYQKIFIIKLILIAVFLFFSNNAQAADFYVDPVNGSMSNDGSQAHPWSTMQEVWEQNKIRTKISTGVVKNPSGVVDAGDTIYLMSGYHGKLTVNVAYNDFPITIKAYTGQTPKFCQIYLTAVKNWVFDGVLISPSYTEPYVKGYLFYVANTYFGDSSYITIKNSTLFSTPDLNLGTKQDWMDKSCTAIITQTYQDAFGPSFITVESNNIYNVTSGIGFMGSDSIVRGNTINYFNRNAVVVAVADRITIEYNTITNSVYVDDVTPEHDDIIQAWETAEDTVDDLTIRGNIMIARQDIDMPLPTVTVGIGMHDGFFKRMLIENNILIINSASAIIINGAIDCTIINNTIAPPTTGGAATVAIFPHKDTRVGYDNVVKNNFFTGVSVSTGGGIEDHNITIGGVSDNFVDVHAYDYRLVHGSPAINAGSTSLAPTIDLLKIARDGQPDIGAYEYNENIPSDTTPPASPTNLSVE
jgi:hypothetical protein